MLLLRQACTTGVSRLATARRIGDCQHFADGLAIRGEHDAARAREIAMKSRSEKRLQRLDMGLGCGSPAV